MATILAVDDDPLIRRCIDRILRREGHEVIQASHGGDALRLAADRAFDVALVDYQLPLLDGLEVLSRLRELQPSCLRVLVTGRLDLPLVMSAVNRGEITRVVEKPFQTKTLVSAVQDALAARQRMVEVARVQEEAQAERQRSVLTEFLRDGHLRLALQPIVRARGAEVFAYEALLRSTHPQLDGPLPVLRAAERYDMVHDLARVVAERAVEWLQRIPPPTRLFLNLHPDELGDPDRVAERADLLAPWADRLVLEITERSKLKDIELWSRTVELLTGRGFSLAVDDLGAGYSSLSVLAELQPRYIKIDMSIVRGVDHDPRKQRLVELLCRFADATGAVIVAEGVETTAEAEVLRRIGAHLLQGYLFGRPELELPEAARLAS